MGTTYTGSRASSNDPNGAPEPGRAPSATVPLDGDPRNASTYLPGYKALADWIDWLRRPIAKVADWVTPLKKYQTAQGHSRHVIDHLGFPGGPISTYLQDWRNAPFMPPLGASTPIGDGWSIRDNGGAGAALLVVNPPEPSGAYARHRRLRMKVQPAAGAYQHVLLSEPTTFHGTVHAAFEATVLLGAADPGIDVEVGLITGNLAPGGFARFIKRPGTSAWACETSTDGSVVDAASAGVDPTTTEFQRLRVEYHGASVADDGVAAVCFYINGALVRRVTTNLPSALADMVPLIKVSYVSAGVAEVMLGPCRFAHNHYGTDV